MDDDELIREFASSRSEQALRRLVDPHCDLFFNVASRGRKASSEASSPRIFQ